MPNIASQISGHNKKTLEKSEQTNQPETAMCNCRDKPQCPLNGECLAHSIIYQGLIEPTKGKTGRYIGLCEPDFKGRHRDHKTSCKYEKYESKTELSKYFWKHKKEGIHCNIKFSILQRRYPYRIGSTKCDLCLTEKLLILKEGKTIINKRDELVSKCAHVNKFLLRNFKSKHK